MQTFHDGSDFAPIAKSAPAAVSELLRGEDFVTAAEVENMQYDMPTEGYEDPLVHPFPTSFAGGQAAGVLGTDADADVTRAGSLRRRSMSTSGRCRARP